MRSQMEFCIRDDDTSYFTSPDELEAVYGEVSVHGPVSLAVVPYHRAGTSKGVPEHLHAWDDPSVAREPFAR